MQISHPAPLLGTAPLLTTALLASASLVQVEGFFEPPCRSVNQGFTEALLLNLEAAETSNVYDPEEEGRIPHDDPSIGYDWSAFPDIR